MEKTQGSGAVPDSLSPTRTIKTLRAMKAPCVVKRITIDKTEATPRETLIVKVPELYENEVLVPGSLALRFDIDLSGGHANNFLVQNVSRALVSRLVVKFGGTQLQDTAGYDIFKIFKDLFLSQEQRDNMLLEGIQRKKLCKIRSNAGDKDTSGVDAENKLNAIYGNKYRIRLDHKVLTNHGVFYPKALLNDLVFELTLAEVSQVVKGSDPTKLKYKLTNIQFEYEIILSQMLADEARSAYSNGKEFAYDHVQLIETVPFKGSDTLLNIKVNAPGGR